MSLLWECTIHSPSLDLYTSVQSCDRDSPPSAFPFRTSDCYQSNQGHHKHQASIRPHQLCTQPGSQLDLCPIGNSACLDGCTSGSSCHTGPYTPCDLSCRFCQRS